LKYVIADGKITESNWPMSAHVSQAFSRYTSAHEYRFGTFILQTCQQCCGSDPLRNFSKS